MDACTSWEEYSVNHPPAANLPQQTAKVAKFCEYHTGKGNKVVLITSGGTVVPMEQKTVRFIDNFSAGTRGSASAEYFLGLGYAVIFMHRTKSLQPFIRHVDVEELMKSFSLKEIDGNASQKIEVDSDHVPHLYPIIGKFQEICRNNLLIKVSFTTLTEYVHLLHEISCILHSMKKNVMIYLAAAVADFYVPAKSMPTHKLSSNEQLNLNFEMSPKLLKPLIKHWAPDAFVISFKLETDETVLIKQARKALESYGHQLVIANCLDDRKRRVILVDQTSENPITMSDEEMGEGKEIEEKIVDKLVHLHSLFMSK